MKYINPTACIPYYDNEVLNYMTLSFKGTVDRRRIYREIRKYCQRAFNTTPDKHFVRKQCRILVVPKRSPEDLNKAVKGFQQWLTEHHEQTERDTADKDSIS